MQFCDEFENFFWKYLYIIISSVGFILNMLCTLVFLRSPGIKQAKSDAFKYLSIKSFCDAYILFRNVIYYISGNCTNCVFNINHSACMVYFVFNFYTGRAALLFSMFLECAANLNRYRVITNRLSFFDKLKFRHKILAMIFYCLIFYIYVFFQEDCVLDVKKNRNSSIQYYKVAKTSFYSSTLAIALKAIHGIVRDIVLEILIAIVSILTLIYIRDWILKKKTLNGNNDAANDRNAKIEKKEIHLTLMILTTSLTNFIGHIFSFLFSLPIEELIRADCLSVTSNLLLYLSYAVNFFIYYAFNKHFQAYFKIKWVSCNFWEKIKTKSNSKKYQTSTRCTDQRVNR